MQISDSTMGASNVPLERITPENTTLQRKTITLHSTTCSSVSVNAITAGSVMNNATRFSLNQRPYNDRIEHQRSPRDRPSNWSICPAPIACAPKIEAAMLIDIAGNCT